MRKEIGFWISLLVGIMLVASIPLFASHHPRHKVHPTHRHFSTGYYKWHHGHQKMSMEAAVLPASFDWRSRFTLSPILDQDSPASCGSCYAHGTTSSIQDCFIVSGYNPPQLSPESLMCGENGGACRGGDLDCMDQAKDYGICSVSECPYTASCRHDCSCTDPWKITGWGEIDTSNIDNIKQAIFQYGPVPITIFADQNLMDYDGGLYDPSYCSNGTTNHIVALVGWDDSTGTWIMRNSWGKSWGESGWGHIPYGCDNIGQEAGWISVPQLPTPTVTPTPIPPTPTPTPTPPPPIPVCHENLWQWLGCLFTHHTASYCCPAL